MMWREFPRQKCKDCSEFFVPSPRSGRGMVLEEIMPNGRRIYKDAGPICPLCMRHRPPVLAALKQEEASNDE